MLMVIFGFIGLILDLILSAVGLLIRMIFALIPLVFVLYLLRSIMGRYY